MLPLTVIVVNLARVFLWRMCSQNPISGENYSSYFQKATCPDSANTLLACWSKWFVPLFVLYTTVNKLGLFLARASRSVFKPMFQNVFDQRYRIAYSNRLKATVHRPRFPVSSILNVFVSSAGKVFWLLHSACLCVLHILTVEHSVYWQSRLLLLLCYVQNTVTLRNSWGHETVKNWLRESQCGKTLKTLLWITDSSSSSSSYICPQPQSNNFGTPVETIVLR